MKKGLIFLAGMVTTAVVQKLWKVADNKFGITEKVSKKISELKGQAGGQEFDNPQ